MIVVGISVEDIVAVVVVSELLVSFLVIADGSVEGVVIG